MSTFAARKREWALERKIIRKTSRPNRLSRLATLARLMEADAEEEELTSTSTRDATP